MSPDVSPFSDKGKKNVANEMTERTPLTVFLTGASSGLGKAVAEALVKAGHKIFGLVDTTQAAHDLRALGGVAVYADLQRASELQSVMQMAKADVVVNAQPQLFNDVPFLRVEFDGVAYVAQSKALAQASRAVGVKFIVHLSFAWAYGDQHGAVVDETYKPNKSEDAIVKAAIDAENAFLKGDVPAAVLRLGFVYGSHSMALASLLKTLRRGRFAPVNEAPVNWVHEDDAAEAVRRVVEAMPKGEIFNVTDDTPVSTLDFVAEVAQAIGLQAPGKGLQFLARMGLGDFTPHVAKLPVMCSNTKIKEALGWRPVYPTQKGGIEHALLLWRAAEAAQP